MNAIVTTEPAALNENTALIAMLERVTLNPDVDPAKLEKLLDLQERVLNKQAESDYAQAMSAAQAEMKRVGTDADRNAGDDRRARLHIVREVPVGTSED